LFCLYYHNTIISLSLSAVTRHDASLSTKLLSHLVLLCLYYHNAIISLSVSAVTRHDASLSTKLLSHLVLLCLYYHNAIISLSLLAVTRHDASLSTNGQNSCIVGKESVPKITEINNSLAFTNNVKGLH